MKITIPVLGLSQHGGIRVLIQIANQLVEDGLSVQILCPVGSVNCKYVIDSRVEVVELGLNTNIKILSWIYFIFCVVPFLKSSMILANHFLTFYPAFFSSIIYKKTKFKYIVQDVEYRLYHQPLKGVLAPICLLTYFSKNTVPANEYLLKEIIKYRVPSYVLKLGISNVFFTKMASSSIKDYDILYFARHEAYKRLDRFLDLLPTFQKKGLKVLCITQEVDLIEKLEAYGCKVESPRSDSEIVSLIDRCKIMLLTSEHEGFALPPLECMARGVPVILYPCGGPSIYCVDKLNSIFVRNSNEVENAIDFFLNNDDCYNEFSKNAIKTSLGFKFESELIKFSSMIQSLY